MGSAGAVRQVADRFPETFVVIGCDDVTDIDLDAALRFHRDRRAEATIVLVEVPDVSHYGAVIVDDRGRIVEFQEKPAPGTARSNLANTGVYIFEPEVLRRIPPKTFYDFGRQVFPELLAAGSAFYGIRQQAYWCDVGTPGEYRRVHRDALSGRIHLELPEGSTLSNGVLIGKGANVSTAATIEAPTVIGAGCTIEQGAHIISSILWDGVYVGAGARVADAVLGTKARVEAGATVTGGEVANATRVAAR
jgi:NDP-sugar pyrophosphorylase family protein